MNNPYKIQQEIHVYEPYEALSTFSINISSHTEYYQNMYHKNLYAKILYMAVGGVKSPLVERILVYGFPSYNALKAR